MGQSRSAAARGWAERAAGEAEVVKPDDPCGDGEAGLPPNEQAVATDMRTEIRRALGTIRSFIAQSFYVWFCARRVTIVSYTDDAPRVPAPQVFFSEFRVAGDVRKLSA